MPISRFLEYLERTRQPAARTWSCWSTSFNPRGGGRRDVPDVRSRSAGTARLYDCDFNQMLELPVEPRGAAARSRALLARRRRRPAPRRDRPPLLRLHGRGRARRARAPWRSRRRLPGREPRDRRLLRHRIAPSSLALGGIGRATCARNRPGKRRISSEGSVAGKKTDTIAVDVLLEPDARMLAHAEANNARLLAVFPGGFALDAAHRPHITLLQCFVAAEGLEGFHAAVGDVLRNARVTGMALQAVRYYYEPGPGAGVAGICAGADPRAARAAGERDCRRRAIHAGDRDDRRLHRRPRQPRVRRGR